MKCIYLSLSQTCNNIYKNEYINEKLDLVMQLAKKFNLSEQEIEKLKEKSAAVQYAAGEKTFIIMAKKIHDKRALKEDGFQIYDLDDMM